MNYDGLEQVYWTTQIERVERMRAKIAARAEAPAGRVVPDDSDLSIGSGRRLDLTILFIDISGFSSRPSGTAAEQELMLRVLNLFMSEMFKIAEDYGGTVEKNTGDGLMAYFENEGGETSAKRAIACALTMHAANEYLLTPILRATGVAPIEFRVSMDSGDVLIANIGSAKRFRSNVAIGAVANFASKMLRHVPPGSIGLGEVARSLLPPDWQIQWTELSTISTEWVRRGTTVPYKLYHYTGRWVRTV